ncbi:MAG: SAM-dependent methyltransferase, partial [Lachnospiraceae bacterium]|nr:SAM-dependent methyltransferase [Lachnospiraceae bacterium]
IRPVLIGDALKFQETRYQGTKVFHENYDRDQMAQRIEEELTTLFRQGEMSGKELTATVLVSKKGKMTVKSRRKAQSGKEEDRLEQLSHNRKKTYLLPEGEPVDFLVKLGVQTPNGQVTKNRYDKFRQINRYLEFIDDVMEELPKDRTIHVVDFGCGKSYLTFATYYYLHVKQGRDVKVTGLDLKEDVIRHCNELAQSLKYDGLHFEQGDIAAFTGEGADLVISLHACDLATDYAIEKAVKWGAKVILAVPCCQHELNRQIKSDVLRPALKYGIIKERIAALLTDAVRAEILERNGYHTQILEFIDMEHTPKNLLIRAVKHSGMRAGAAGKSLEEMEEFLHVSPTLEKLLGD